MYARPVELHRGPYRVRAASEDRYLSFAAYDVVLGTVVREVEVVRLGGEFTRKGIYLFYDRQDLQPFAEQTDGRFGRMFDNRELRIRKSGLLRPAHESRIEFFTFQLFLKRDDILHFVQKPEVYLRKFVYLLNADAEA